MRHMVKAVTFSVKAPAYKGYYVLRVIKVSSHQFIFIQTINIMDTDTFNAAECRAAN